MLHFDHIHSPTVCNPIGFLFRRPVAFALHLKTRWVGFGSANLRSPENPVIKNLSGAKPTTSHCERRGLCCSFVSMYG
jgi:hypothetical protein